LIWYPAASKAGRGRTQTPLADFLQIGGDRLALPDIEIGTAPKRQGLTRI
jgi:hypothetical protein